MKSSTNSNNSNSNNYSDGYNNGYNTGRNTTNNYYYDNSGSSFNNFMSHYFLYRALTHHNDRAVIVNGSNPYGYAPVYGGVKSIVYDIITFITLIAIIIFAVIMYRKLKRRRNRLY
jgi:hypothetical protein